MKLHQLIFAILLTGLYSCQSKKGGITITGKILGEVLEKVDYTVPINGVCDYAFKESVKPDSSGNFKINMEIENPSFVELFVGIKKYGTLLVEAGKHYDIEIDVETKGNSFKINGENQKGQRVYDSLPNPSNIQLGAREFFKDSVASVVQNKLKSRKDSEIALFDELLLKGDISGDFFQLVKLDRECYYSSLQATVAFVKQIINFKDSIGDISPEFKKMWGESFVETSPTTNTYVRSPWYYSLLDNFVDYQELTQDSFDVYKIREELSRTKLYHTHTIVESKKYLPIDILEYHNASHLSYAYKIKKSINELPALFEEYEKDFPNSEYNKYLKPKLNSIVEVLNKNKEKPDNQNIKFVEGYDSINSLKESVRSFKGKKVYVDVWASWCGPCKAEFEHKAKLKKLLASQNIELLYLSIDRDEYETQWKDMISNYNLEGDHIRANQKLNADLKRIFNRNGSIKIPWYILIDENGNIIKEHASRPSQLNELEKEINECQL